MDKDVMRFAELITKTSQIIDGIDVERSGVSARDVKIMSMSLVMMNMGGSLMKFIETGDIDFDDDDDVDAAIMSIVETLMAAALFDNKYDDLTFIETFDEIDRIADRARVTFTVYRDAEERLDDEAEGREPNKAGDLVGILRKQEEHDD